MDFKGLFFSIEGRLNRISFFLLGMFVGVVFSVISTIVGFILPTGTASIVSIILYVINTIIGIFLSIKRVHDFDKSGYFLLAYSVVASIIVIAIALIFSIVLNNDRLGTGCAIIGALIVVLYIYLKPGTAGVNKYGNQPVTLFDLGLGNNEEAAKSVISDNSNNQ